MKITRIVLIGLSLAALLTTNVRAELLIVEPARSTLLPAARNGKTEVALYFDLSGLPGGEKRVINMVHLEWTPSSQLSNQAGTYTAQEITGNWTAQGVGINGLSEVSSEMAALWRVEPGDFERTSGIVRLELTSSVDAWTKGVRTNHGVVVSSNLLSRSVALSQLSSVRLVIRYGYR